ncbi:MAG: hypothetical protein Phog2KO_08680 [Phototrophicaceae bacterium]
MQNIEYQIRREHYKDLAREAQNERLAHSVEANHSAIIKNARQAIGRRLVQAGHQLLDER